MAAPGGSTGEPSRFCIGLGAHALLFLSCLQLTCAPIPCSPQLTVLAQVGENERYIGLTQDIEHGDIEERDCVIVNPGYEGMIVIGCDEGILNVTVEGCTPMRCRTYSSLSVRLGTESIGVMPLQIIQSGGVEVRLCRTSNPLYRGKFYLYCNFGQLSVDMSDCVTQWDPMDIPPWTPRTKHTAVGLSDGTLLTLGGIGNLGPVKEVWHWTPGDADYNASGLTGTWVPTLQVPPWSGRFGAAAVAHMQDSGEQVMFMGGNDGFDQQDTWRWIRHPTRQNFPLADGAAATGSQVQACSFYDGDPGVAMVTCSSDFYNDTSATGDVGPVRTAGWLWEVPELLKFSTEYRIEVRLTMPPIASMSAPSTPVSVDAGYNASNASSVNLSYGDASNATVNHSSTDAGTEIVGFVVLDLWGCNLVFQVTRHPHLQDHARWCSLGCVTSSMEPWTIDPDLTQCFNGTMDPSMWHTVSFTVDRPHQQVVLAVDGEILPSTGTMSTELGMPVIVFGDIVCPENWTSRGTVYDDDIYGNESCTVLPATGNMMAFQIVELAAMPGCILQLRNSTIMAPGGYWELLTETPPWPIRSSHAAVGLPDGDILVMGGLGGGGLYNDVWRWSPRYCVRAEDLQSGTSAEVAAMAATLPLNCDMRNSCEASPKYGQWTHLPDAAWLPRQEHAAIWTSMGVLVLGGRTSTGFVNDVWRWQSSGDFCSSDWYGTWELLTPAAAWPPRHGHSVVGFVPPGRTDTETVLLVGGYGGYPEHEFVERIPVNFSIESRNDIWCGNLEVGGFATWTQLAPSAPFTPRSQAAAVRATRLVPEGGFALVFFGGYDSSARITADMWRWAGENATFRCQWEDTVADLVASGSGMG